MRRRRQRGGEGGGERRLRINYTLDLGDAADQAASIIAKLKNEGITSVGCGCDPLLPIFLTGKAKEQNYYPSGW